MQDKQLLRQLKNGDRKAFEKIYVKYSKVLGFFLMGYLKSVEDTEEVIQDAFIKIWENKKAIDPNQSFKNYLFKISKHVFLNKLRRKNVEENYRNNFLANFSEEDNSTENSIIFSDYEEFYIKAVNNLPPKRRNIFIMSRKQGLTYDEIAKKLNISQKTVEKQMSEALRYLRTQLWIENGSILHWLVLLILTAYHL